MLTALHLSSPPKEAFSIPEISITNAKVQKVAFVVFGGVSFFVANTLLGFGGLIALLSIPFYLLTVTFAIRFFEVKDYDNSTKLEAYRQEANEQTFEEVIRAHGLFNTLKYEILSLPVFTRKLGLYLDTITPTLLAKLYQQLINATEELGLSIENFRKIFVDSLNRDSRDKASVMFEKEDMSLLLRTGLIDERCATSYQDYRKLKDTREENNEQSREKFARGCLEAIQLIDSALSEAQSDTQDVTDWIATLRKDIAYLRNHPYPSSATDHLPIWQKPKEEWSDVSELIAAHRTFTKTFKQLTSALEQETNEQRCHFDREVVALDAKFVAR